MAGGKYEDDQGKEQFLFSEGWEKSQSCWTLAGACGDASWQRWWFWRLKAIDWLAPPIGARIKGIEQYMARGVTVHLVGGGRNWYTPSTNTLEWDSSRKTYYDLFQAAAPPRVTIKPQPWMDFHPLAGLAHELGHLSDDLTGRPLPDNPVGLQQLVAIEKRAMGFENSIRGRLRAVDPALKNSALRPHYFPDEWYAYRRLMDSYWRGAWNRVGW